MSTGDSRISGQAPSTKNDSPSEHTLDDVVLIVTAVRQRLSNLESDIEDLRNELSAEREYRDTLEDDLAEIRDSIGALDSRTDLLRLISKADETDGEQRSTALILHLSRVAEKSRERGDHARASVNRNGAEEALHCPNVERTTIYRDMQRAVRLVGDEDVLWYGSTDGEASRLVLDLEAGDLPDRFTEESGL